MKSKELDTSTKSIMNTRISANKERIIRILKHMLRKPESSSINSKLKKVKNLALADLCLI